MNVTEFARKTGYEGAVFLHSWRGYRCYRPVLKDDSGLIGLPLVILKKGNEIRMSTPDEALEHFDEKGWTD